MQSPIKLKSTLSSQQQIYDKSDYQTTGGSPHRYMSTSPIQRYSPINSTYITPISTTKLRLDNNSNNDQPYSTSHDASMNSTTLNKVNKSYNLIF